jgi:hypothetical protein
MSRCLTQIKESFESLRGVLSGQMRTSTAEPKDNEDQVRFDGCSRILCPMWRRAKSGGWPIICVTCILGVEAGSIASPHHR